VTIDNASGLETVGPRTARPGRNETGVSSLDVKHDLPLTPCHAGLATRFGKGVVLACHAGSRVIARLLTTQWSVSRRQDQGRQEEQTKPRWRRAFQAVLLLCRWSGPRRLALCQTCVNFEICEQLKEEDVSGNKLPSSETQLISGLTSTFFFFFTSGTTFTSLTCIALLVLYLLLTFDNFSVCDVPCKKKKKVERKKNRKIENTEFVIHGRQKEFQEITTS
jgi:hypothetical protein